MSIEIILVDDDQALRRATRQTLELGGYAVRDFGTAPQALTQLARDSEAVVISDIRMAGMDGLELFAHIRALDPDLPVLLITGHGDVDMAVRALHDGAYDFIAKPFPADRLVQSVARAAEKRRLVLENRRLREAATTTPDDLPLIGQTPAMQHLRQTLRQIADTDVDVLIAGETGSGKEVVATLLHRWSRRSRGNFVALNCGALPETVIESELFGHEPGAFTGAQKKRVGRIEHASGGTLFLDEIESMPLSTQVKMLRVLEMREVSPLGTNEIRPVDLRVVAAAKLDLGNPAAARTPRRHPVALRPFRHPRRRAFSPRDPRHDGRRAPPLGEPRLAGQCPRTLAFCRTRRARHHPAAENGVTCCGI